MYNKRLYNGHDSDMIFRSFRRPSYRIGGNPVALAVIWRLFEQSKWALR
jgi:hypothetical protein